MKAVVRAAATLLALAVAGWWCLEAAPGHPAEAAARASGLIPADPSTIVPGARREIVLAVARREGLDRPAGARFGAFLAGALRGDLGRSWRDGRPVTRHLGRALPVTLALVGAALVLAFALGLLGALGAAAGARRWPDRATRAVAVIALSIPPAWAAVLALRAGPGSWPLAIGCLAYVAAAVVARHGRAAILAAAREPFALAARARGASGARVLGVHALGAAASSLAALATVVVPYLLGASLIVERAFDLRGLGALLLDAASAGDAPVTLGATLAVGALVALASIASDAVAVVADPRLRR
jgi:nickel transport system permease protein